MILSMNEEERKQIIENAYAENQRYSIDAFYENMLEVYHRAIRKMW